MADRWLAAIRHPLDATECRAVETSLYERARLGGPATTNFVVLSVLSSAIASMGLLLDSAPAVIGAMLLGPFIVPLLGVAGSSIQGGGPRFWRALAMVVLGVVVSAATAFVVGRVFAAQLEFEELPAFLESLTRPGLLDLGIALTAGVAAGFATTRTEVGGALSGVAVSVTLEPPLAALGLFLAAGDLDSFRSAALAFGTNFGALILGAGSTMAWAGLGSWGTAERRTSVTTVRSRLGLAAWVAVVVGLMVPLAVYSRRVIDAARFERTIAVAVEQWDPSVRVTDIEVESDGRGDTVTIGLVGSQRPEPAWRLAEALERVRGRRVAVVTSFTLSVEDRAVSAG